MDGWMDAVDDAVPVTPFFVHMYTDSDDDS